MDNIEKIVKQTHYLLIVFKDTNLLFNEKSPTGRWTTSEKQFSSMYSRQFDAASVYHIKEWQCLILKCATSYWFS